MNIGGPYADRDEAIREGRHNQGGDPFYICFASIYQWAAPDASSVMDQWIENHDELWFEDSFPGFNGPDQASRERLAENHLQTLLNTWFDTHKDLVPQGNAFSSQSSGEWIDKPEPIEADAMLAERMKGQSDD